MKRREFCKAALLSSMAAVPAYRWKRAGADPVSAKGGDVPAIKLDGDQTVIPAAALQNFTANFHGRVLTASDPDYEQARRIWNPMIDRRPAVIARCIGAADIQRAVVFCRERELLVAVRGGGHSFPGYSTCNGGFVIDLSGMRGVRVDPMARTAQVAGGAWNGDLDWEAQQSGLATPMGNVSHTGVGGLTLGGGYGRLSRLHGLACDNVLSADLITADAKLLHVSASENPDLFWAIRGGGGNFGVVSSFEYRLHPVGPKVLAGELMYAPAQTRSILEHYAGYAARAPRELSLGAQVRSAKPGERTLVAGFCFLGEATAGERVLELLRADTKPDKENVTSWDYVQLQKRYDGPMPSDYTEYMKSGYVGELTPALIEAILQEQGAVELGLFGGAVADITPTATAVAHRQEPFQMAVSATWRDRADNDRKRAEVHAIWDRLSRFTTGFYANLNIADQKSVDDNWGPNRTRLMQIKKQYDRGNFFRLNANIRPAA